MLAPEEYAALDRAVEALRRQFRKKLTAPTLLDLEIEELALKLQQKILEARDQARPESKS